MATWDRYTSTVTGLEVQSRIGPAFYIRSFCDDPLGSVYVSKAPVCKLSLIPTVQFVNTNIAWDISASRSATGTIDTFDISWGGTTDIGDLSAQTWASDPKTGNVQYTATGTYTVTATVTDTLGNVSTPQKITVEIVEYVAVQRLYIGTTGDGLYLLTPADGVQPWNGNLSGNDLKLRSVRVHPNFADLPPEQHHLWACTAAGLAVSVDGGLSWATTAATDLGTPAGAGGEASADLDQIDVAFDPLDWQHVLLLRSTATGLWVYETSDYGASWANYEVA